MFEWRRTADNASRFGQLALVHLDSLYRIAHGLVGNPVDAEDLLQETYTRAYTAFHQLHTEDHCRPWLTKILYNTWRNQLKHKQNGIRWSAYNDDFTGTPVPSCEDELVAQTFSEEVERALQRLAPEVREMIVLADIEGLKCREISEITGCPIGTVAARLSRGRYFLRKKLSRVAQSWGYI